MAKPTGKRAAHKDATRAALQEAARRLFAQHGYESTTVREISQAAGVTERTFYRYFDGKEGLLAGEALAWIDALHDGIRNRPAEEPPLIAIHRALAALARQATRDIAPNRYWLLDERSRLFELLRSAGLRPLRRVEQSIADAVFPRIAADNVQADTLAEFQAQVLGRVAVAALRSALIRQRELRATKTGPTPPLERLLDEAFAVITASGAPLNRTSAVHSSIGRTDRRRAR
jgi:AcrR family transcriptional regulator